MVITIYVNTTLIYNLQQKLIKNIFRKIYFNSKQKANISENIDIGLANKMRAYALQDEGFDTVEANHRLGFEDDERNFQIAASILKELKISSIRLMTNNPRKIKILEENGLNVTERLALIVEENELNTHYLGTKAKKSGHLL